MKRRPNKNEYGFINKTVDVRPLNQRESKLNTRKGMLREKCKGFFDKTEYKEQLLFDNSQSNCNGHANK